MPDDRPIDRRRFFREGLRELLKPLANATEPIERALKELEALDNGTPRVSRPSPQQQIAKQQQNWLRPPGALEEQKFLDTCSRCGVCVSVCPAQCIKIDTSGIKGNGAPYIIASEMACVVCDGLHCMQNCPSGALLFTPAADIDMGTAVWHEHLCARTHGEDCRICVEQCPIGAVAITLDETGKVKVHDEGCIGCGVCEQQCPTTPKSITIRPRSAT
jgi:MauM/NapG family ferredoxin protein